MKKDFYMHFLLENVTIEEGRRYNMPFLLCIPHFRMCTLRFLLNILILPFVAISAFYVVHSTNLTFTTSGHRCLDNPFVPLNNLASHQ